MIQQNNNYKSMAGYYFIIYFQLFVSAFLSLISAVTVFTGWQYGEVGADAVYAFYGFPLKLLDITMGILYIIACILAIITRQQLSHFKKNAYKLYLVNAMVNLGIVLFYIIMTSILTKYLNLTSNTIANLLGTTTINILFYMYLKNRASLFNK